MRKKAEKNEENFVKPRKIICYRCGQAGHLKYQCPKIPNHQNPVHHIKTEKKLGEGFESYLGKMVINGWERNYLKDSGSCIDAAESDMISVEDILREKVWVKQPFDLSCREFPLAKIILEGNFGKITTKTAVKPAELSEGYYLLGYRTAELISSRNEKAELENAIMGRKSWELKKPKLNEKKPVEGS